MANPTTNYSWPMPTSADLVTDLPADFALFGQPVDTSLKALNPETTLGDIAFRSSTSNTNTRLGIGSNGQVLTVASGVPSWATASDQTPLTTKGDLFTFSTVDARLAVGTNTYVLTADSAEATGIKWAAAAGGGKVLQVVTANTTTATANSTTTMADTTLTATITPTLITSKVLVLVSQNGLLRSVANSANGVNINLLRGSSVISQVMSAGLLTDTALLLTGMQAGANYLDSPATTSATTYKTQFSNRSASAEVRVQQASDMSSIVLLEIGA